jgi:hypothetical protein
MLFSPNSNSRLGIVGTCILIAFFALIGISILIILRDSSVSSDVIRAIHDVESNPLAFESQQHYTSSAEQKLAKRTTVFYGVGLCCQYVLIPI